MRVSHCRKCSGSCGHAAVSTNVDSSQVWVLHCLLSPGSSERVELPTRDASLLVQSPDEGWKGFQGQWLLSCGFVRVFPHLLQVDLLLEKQKGPEEQRLVPTGLLWLSHLPTAKLPLDEG